MTPLRFRELCTPYELITKKMGDAYDLLTRVRNTRPDDYRRLAASAKDATPCLPLDVIVNTLKERTLCHFHNLIDRAVQRGLAANTLHASIAAVLRHIHGTAGADDVLESLKQMSFPRDVLKAAGTTMQRWNRLHDIPASGDPASGDPSVHWRCVQSR